jgi:hypothetical protein
LAQPTPEPAEPRPHPADAGVKLIVIAVAAVVVVFALFVWALWRFGFFDFTGSDPSSKIVAAAFALVGAMFSALVTVVGLVFKHSVDLRSLALQEQAEARARTESERNSRLAVEAEGRLKLEAAIQAVGLLGRRDGGEPPPTQMAGVILTLGDLGMYPLAISLADQMLAAGQLHPGTACWLFNEALASDNPDVSNQAAIMTNKHAPKMLLPGGEAVFPAVLMREEYVRLPNEVRQLGVYALIDLVLSRPYREWNHDTVSNVISWLHHVWKTDPDQDVRDGAGVALLTFFRALDPAAVVELPSGPQEARAVLEELKAYDGALLNGRIYGGKPRSVAMLEWGQKPEQEPADATRD